MGKKVHANRRKKTRKDAERRKARQVEATPLDKALPPTIDVEDLDDATGGAVAVRLHQVIVRSLLSNDDRKAENVGGPLNITIQGQSTLLNWGMKYKNKKFETNETTFQKGRLLYAGKPNGALNFDVSMIESDQDQADALKGLASVLEFLGTVTSLVPVYGTVAGAGFNLGSSIANFFAGQQKNDLELYYAGGIGSLLDKSESNPQARTVPSGILKIIRPVQGATNPTDIEIHLKIDALNESDKDLKKDDEVLVVLRNIGIADEDGKPYELEMDKGDKVIVETKVKGGSKAQEFQMNVQGFPGDNTLSAVTNIEDHVIYRGKWGSGVSAAVSITVAPEDVISEAMPIIEKAKGFADALDPEQTDTTDKIQTVVQATSELITSVSPKVRHSLGGGDLYLTAGKKSLTASSLKGVNATFYLEIIPVKAAT